LMNVKGAVTALLISFLLLPHLVLIYSVLGTEEPGWSHQVREVPVPPRPEGGKVIVVDQSGRGDFRSISEAVDAARPGDRILVMPGVYRESVTVSSKPWLEIVGVDRDSVVLDGENRLGNGIYVVFSPHVTVANLTVRNYLGNGIFYVNSDYFRVERVRAENNRVYGINFLASEKGVVSRVIAYGSGDSGIYVGEVSERCECVVEYSEAFNNTLGYSGTRANGVTIRYSHFHDNGIGIAPNTLLPNLRLFLTGRWPLMVWASNNVIEHNLIENNNNRNLRAAGFAASYGIPVGVGIAMIGSHSNVVRNNTIRGHEKWGIAEWYFLVPPVSNVYVRNSFIGNGMDYWSDGWGFFRCSEGESATGDVPPPCDLPAPLRLTVPNPLKDLQLLLTLEVPGAAVTWPLIASALSAALVGGIGYAGKGSSKKLRLRRLLSSLIDLLLVGNIFLLFAAALMVFGFGLTDFSSVTDGVVSFTLLLLPLAYTIVLVTWFLYGLVTESVFGRTLGKWATGLKISFEGRKPPFLRTLLRNLFRTVDLLLFGLPGLLVLLLTGRTVGDIVSGVRVEGG